MKEGIRMYHTLFPRKYWILLVYLLFPATVGILGMWCFQVGPVVGTLVSLMFATAVLVIAEYVLDIFMLYGTVSKEARSLEYIKTSAKGVDLFQTALYADGVRRIVTTMASFGILYGVTRYNFSHQGDFITIVNNGEILTCPKGITFLECALVSVIFVELGLIITRRTQSILLYVFLIYGMSGIASALVMFLAEYTNGILLAITVGVFVAVWLGSRRYLVWKVRMSYYDK